MATSFSYFLSRRVRLALLGMVLLLNGCHANTRWLFQQRAGNLDPSEIQGCGVGAQCLLRTRNPDKMCPNNEECRICNEGDGNSGWCVCPDKYKRTSAGECIPCPTPAYINEDDVCVCPKHYYPESITSKDKECTFCPPPGNFMNDMCECPDGTSVSEDGVCTCEIANTVYVEGSGCVCTPEYTELVGDECVCIDNYVFDDDSGECVPKDCDNCEDGYQKKSNGDCIYCPSPAYINEDDVCVCPKYYYPESITNEGEECTFCPPPGNFMNDMCECPDGTSVSEDGVCTCEIANTVYVEGSGCVCAPEYTELINGECACIDNYVFDAASNECVPKDCDNCDDDDDDDDPGKCKLPFKPTDKNDWQPGQDAQSYDDLQNEQLWPTAESAPKLGQRCAVGYEPIKANKGRGVSCWCHECTGDEITYGDSVYALDTSGITKYFIDVGGVQKELRPYELYCHTPQY